MVVVIFGTIDDIARIGFKFRKEHIMKSYPNTTLKVFWLMLLLLSIVFGLEAKNNHSVLSKTSNPKFDNLKVKEILKEEAVLVEENPQLEDWMFLLVRLHQLNQLPLCRFLGTSARWW